MLLTACHRLSPSQMLESLLVYSTVLSSVRARANSGDRRAASLGVIEALRARASMALRACTGLLFLQARRRLSSRRLLLLALACWADGLRLAMRHRAMNTRLPRPSRKLTACQNCTSVLLFRRAVKAGSCTLISFSGSRAYSS